MYQFYWQFFWILFLAQIVQYSHTIFLFNLFEYSKKLVLFLHSAINSFSVSALPPLPPPTITTDTKTKAIKSTKETLTIEPNSNASTTGNKAQESKHMTGSELKCPQCFLTNDKGISRAVFGDTSEGGWMCIICYNLCLQSSDEVLLVKK